MANRYLKQIDFSNGVCFCDCPVALEKGAVLLDAKNNTYMLQLKLANIGMSGVKSARVFIEAYGESGNQPYKGIAADYNESAQPGEAFGAKQLLPLPDNSAASFFVYVEKITFDNGESLDFSRELYQQEADSRDIPAIREEAFSKNLAEQMRQAKILKSMWNSKWYYAVFILFMILSFPLFDLNYQGESVSLFVVFLFFLPALCNIALLIFAFRNAGTPRILKPLSISALAFPLLNFIFSVLINLFFGSLPNLFLLLWGLIWKTVICSIPFLCVFLNARRFDKSLNFFQLFLFWLPSESAKKIESKTMGYANKVNNKISEHVRFTGAECPHCGAKTEEKAKFCSKCGGNLIGE